MGGVEERRPSVGLICIGHGEPERRNPQNDTKSAQQRRQWEVNGHTWCDSRRMKHKRDKNKEREI